LSSIAALAVFPALVQAATTINVDFNATGGVYGTYSGEAAAPASGGTTWNGFNVGGATGALNAGPVTSPALVTSTGSATGVTVSLGNFKVYQAAENPATLAPNLMTNFVYQPTLGPTGANSTFSINNLDPGSSYDLYFYAQNAGYSNTATIFTIGALSLTATNTAAPATFTQNGNYVKFTGIVPNGSGVISGTFNDFAPANNAAFNGMQIVQVPEPAALPLAALASGLLFRRRRS
jgi:uncharacterized protein (TIGR03382 family)